MHSYTVLTQSGRARLIRNTADGMSAVVTTIADATQAARVASALTHAVDDLPNMTVCYVLDHTESWHLDPTDYTQDVDVDLDWDELPAPTAPFALKRRALNTFDNGDPARTDSTTGISRNQLTAVITLRGTLAGQPESVVRAVRGELATAFAPYDGPPVIARAYDYKWSDCDQVFVANAGLAMLSADELDLLATGRDDVSIHVLDRLAAAGLADFTACDQVGMSGYLRVAVNKAQLASWIAHHRNNNE